MSRFEMSTSHFITFIILQKIHETNLHYYRTPSSCKLIYGFFPFLCPFLFRKTFFLSWFIFRFTSVNIYIGDRLRALFIKLFHLSIFYIKFGLFFIAFITNANCYFSELDKTNLSFLFCFFLSDY